MTYDQYILSFLVGTIALMVGVFSMLFMRLTKDQKATEDRLEVIKEKTFFSEKELTESRIMLERRIAELNLKLTQTEKGFNDVNHLLVDAQREYTPSKESEKLSVKPFLQSLNVNTNDYEIDPNLVFVLTPFDSLEKPTFAAIVQAFKGTKMRVLRGDEEPAKGDVLSHILRQMLSARIVIANVNTRNPNVMYELGIAHSLNKNVIIVSNNEKNLPFDVNSRRILFYRSRQDLSNKLKSEVLRKLLGESE